MRDIAFGKFNRAYTEAPRLRRRVNAQTT